MPETYAEFKSTVRKVFPDAVFEIADGGTEGYFEVFVGTGYGVRAMDTTEDSDLVTPLR